MEKYKLLIADDESDARDAIVSLIDWDALGYEVAVEAENGQDALEKAESAGSIDVALTDIKMPFMDGLEMGARLIDMYPNIKLIILTGFDEFEYAKAAISLSVVEYVLKPVNAAELSGVLRRVKQQLDESIEQRRNTDMLRESYRQSLPLMREHFLTELIWGMVPDAGIEDRLERFELDIGSSRCCAVAVFEPEPEPMASSLAPELIPVSVKQIIEEQLEGRCKCAVFIGASVITAITFWDDEPAAGILSGIANDICSRCARVLDITVNAGIGRARDSLKDARRSFDEARAALEYKAVVGTGKAVYIQDMERAKREADTLDSRECEQLLSAVKFGADEQFRQYAEKIVANMPEGGETARKAYALYIYGVVYVVMRRYEMFDDAELHEYAEQFINDRGMWADAEKVKNWLEKICALMRRYISNERISAAKNLVEEAKNYISNRYQDHRLSVNELCGRLHVSHSYFSAVFKQETGKCFVQYLTDLRLSHAVGLLEQTDMKTYEIARQVGFDEPNYFSYTFKKRLGVSPTKYRVTTEKPAEPGKRPQ